MKESIYKIKNAWEEFKDTNDKRISEIEEKGSSDCLSEIKLKNISKEIDLYQELEKKEKKDREIKEISEYIIKGILPKHYKTLDTSSGIDLVDFEIQKEIDNQTISQSLFRRIASVKTTTEDSYEVIKQLDQFQAEWYAGTPHVETTTGSFADDNTGKINTFPLYAEPKVEQLLLEDSKIDLEQHILERVKNAFDDKEEDAFINGTGIGMPKGVLKYSSLQIEQLVWVNAHYFSLLQSKFKPEFLKNISIIAHPSVIHWARIISTTTGAFYFDIGAGGEPDKFTGYPIYSSIHMPAFAGGILAMAYGDFKRGYTIVDRKGVTLTRDNISEKPFVRLNFQKRVGGVVTNFDAIKLMRFG